MTPEEISSLADHFESAEAADVLAEAARQFPGGKLGFATGFGVEGCVIIDLAARRGLELDVFTLDTGVLFPQTYELWRKLESTYGITIRGIQPELSLDEQAEKHGARLWERDPDACCKIRKVEPLKKALAPFDAWVTAIRRDQTPDRADAKTFEVDAKFGLVKINPLVRWRSKDVWDHVLANKVPYNPLHDAGYPSIGCEPCTSAVKPGEDPRSGRWRGVAKTECGLHAK